FFYLMTGCGFLLMLFAALTGRSTMGILIALGIGALLPYLWVSFKAKRRMLAFEDQLPDLLVTLAASLKAGHSFKQGIQTLVDEGQEPASKELSRVITDTRLGRPMDEALADTAERIGSKNFSFVITAVTIQRQVGGSLAGLFDMVADTVRQRQQFARKTRRPTSIGRPSVRRAAQYGAFKSALGQAQRPFRERVLVPLGERLAKWTLKLHPKTTIEGVSTRLLAAGLGRSISPTAFLAFKSGLAIVGVFLGILFGGALASAGGVLFCSVAFAGIGFIAPDFVVSAKARSRKDSIRAELPDALDLMAVSVEAGMGFD